MRNLISIPVLLLAACASDPAKAPDQVYDKVIHGKYDEALREASELHAKNPDDPAVDKMYRDVSVAWLLEHGRRLTFQDKDDEAMVAFQQAAALDPTSKETLAWIRKTHHKMSRIWLERALELHASGKLDQAVEAYGNALAYEPGDPSAVNGMGEAVVQIGWRSGMGRAYFEEGLHALSEYWLEQARSRFSYSSKYQPEDAHTKERRGQAEILLAAQRVVVGKRMEADQKFNAARNEFRFAVALDAQNVEARQGLDRATEESRAAELLSQAKLLITRARYDEATKLIDEGVAKTVVQKDAFEVQRAQIEKARFEKLYQEALALERDTRYEAAIAKYDDLLARTEFFKDALARRDVLKEYVKRADELYAKAQAAADDAERIDHLKKIRAFWPEYKDVAEQLKKLEPAKP